MKHINLFIFLLLSAGIVEAQSSGNIHKNYQNGKELFQSGKYELAMQAFTPLAKQDAKNPYTEYASFFYALSAYHAGQTDQSKNMLLQINQKYANWQDIDEARLWLAKIYLEENDYLKGVETLKKIKNKSTRNIAEDLKKHYLDNIEDINALHSLHEAYPKDKEIAVALAENIFRQPLVDQDQKQLDNLVKQFNLDPQAFTSGPTTVSEKKDSYNVAVLLPFLINEVARGRNVGNQFVIDLYEAIQLGNQKLKSEGININLFAYDTRRDSAQTAQLLNMEEMKAMDLIIGPLYPKPSSLASSFTFRNKINMINPISNNSKVIGNNPFSFLFKPSYETQARKAAEFASKEFDNKKTLIIYGTTQRDSILAFNYKNEAEKNNLEIIKMVKVDAIESQKVLRLLAENKDSVSLIPANSIGHIFVTNLDEIVVANVLNGLNLRQDMIALVGSEEWMDFKTVSYEQMERFKIYFIAPNFIDQTLPEVETFRNKFIENTKTLPSQYAYSGYETILFAGRMLHQHGVYFQNELGKTGFKKGEIYPGYNFANSNDNQYVPIIRLLRSDLVIVNHPLNKNDRQAEK